MKLLLDTHTYLWLLVSPRKVGEQTLELVQSGENTVLLSVISLVEIALKAQKGKIEFEFSLVDKTLASIGAQLLDYSYQHIKVLSTLEANHSDPFDRLLISQAISEGASIATINSEIRKYPCSWVW